MMRKRTRIQPKISTVWMHPVDTLRHLNLRRGPAPFAPARSPRPPQASGLQPMASVPQGDDPASLHDGEFLIETSPMPD